VDAALGDHLVMPRDHRLDFGIFLAIHREELDLDGTAMAAAVKTSQTVYSNWERCKALPELEDDVRSLARQLSVPEERLVSIWKRTRKDATKKGDAGVREESEAGCEDDR
jgi:transcriptional regulator with XRE-family HTH domain